MNFSYIADNQDLQTCITALTSASEIAVDLEFDKNRYRYGFNLCLMQIYTGSETYLIDPLSKELDIRLVFPILENPDILKVVFAFSEDLRLLHHIGCFPKNILDLDVITSLLNFAPASLAALLDEVLGIKVGKSSQQSNWFKRPLTKQQIHYAVEDVCYLPELKNELLAQAEKAGILEWINQEKNLLEELDYSDSDHNSIVKEKDKKGLTLFEWFVYKKLMIFVDSVAKKLNKPSYQIVDKRVLLDLVRSPELVEEWTETDGIFYKLKTKSFRKQLKSVLNESIAEAESEGISKAQKAVNSFTKEEYQALREEQRKIGLIKNQIFIPIQQRIQEDYGKHVKSFVLSNRQMKQIITGKIELPEYRKKLFLRYAEELNLDIYPFIQEEKKAS